MWLKTVTNLQPGQAARLAYYRQHVDFTALEVNDKKVKRSKAQ